MSNKLINVRLHEISYLILKIPTHYHLTLSVTSASCKRSYSKLKQIKSYLKTTKSLQNKEY